MFSACRLAATCTVEIMRDGNTHAIWNNDLHKPSLIVSKLFANERDEIGIFRLKQILSTGAFILIICVKKAAKPEETFSVLLTPVRGLAAVASECAALPVGSCLSSCAMQLCTCLGIIAHCCWNNAQLTRLWALYKCSTETTHAHGNLRSLWFHCRIAKKSCRNPHSWAIKLH